MKIEYSHQPFDGAYRLQRRGIELGYVKNNEIAQPLSAEACKSLWWHNESALLPDMIDVVSVSAQISDSKELMERVLDGDAPADLFYDDVFEQRLSLFPCAGESEEMHDRQAIQKVYFDAEADEEVLAEGLWCKASWLSFCDDDASLRFRFSFGMEGFEDVAADPLRQQYAAELCDAIFPESSAVTQNDKLNELLTHVLDSEPNYVERIVYFNAPNGGAQMHHDVERGHQGVVYAQLSGQTFWLALAKSKLMDLLKEFVTSAQYQSAVAQVLADAKQQEALSILVADRQALSDYMEEQDHELVEAIMDRSPAFMAFLIDKNYAYILKPGDALLLPQSSLDECVWHSVFCIGEEAGQALSFAIR